MPSKPSTALSIAALRSGDILYCDIRFLPGDSSEEFCGDFTGLVVCLVLTTQACGEVVSDWSSTGASASSLWLTHLDLKPLYKNR